MIELFYSPTPNGRKISIMLEEIKIKYKITSINLDNPRIKILVGDLRQPNKFKKELSEVNRVMGAVSKQQILGTLT